MLHLSHILITAFLYGLRIVMQLINFSFFKKKALWIINFQPHNSHSSPLFKSFILKFSDKVTLENTLFVSNSINNLLPFLFNHWFLFSSDQHNYHTWSSLGNLHMTSYKTNLYGKNSIIVNAINAWNNLQELLKISQTFTS